MTPEMRRTAEILRTISRDERIKEVVRTSPLLYPLLLTAAKRYVAGETRADAMKIAQRLEKNGLPSIR
ncbi:hypothetical protein [Brevibacillus formosus]|uniref:hypothetical protein n=1 Tax=Brevibacillus formosus TaxID=54913 RepID=UPI00215597C0|nr:hypothetical protein [Brevibacillus formosus]